MINGSLDQVMKVAVKRRRAATAELPGTSAVNQNVQINGYDVTELAQVFAEWFGNHVWQWLWQRFAELSTPASLVFPIFVRRLLTWPFRGRLFSPSLVWRLELGPIATVIDRGEWFEP